jgi:predicted glycosyltransferase
MKNGTLLYYCRWGGGGEALRRTLAIAHHLSDWFDVTVLANEPPPPDTHGVASVRIVLLPEMDNNPETLPAGFDHSARQLEQSVARRDRILATFLMVKPRVVIIESFPLSQRLLAGEVLPLIERAKAAVHGEALLVCSTDGILASNRPNREDYDDESASLLSRYFDLITVHTDSTFARVEEFFRPADALATPLYHTGFVSPQAEARAESSDNDDGVVLVSAGDGLHGRDLFRAAIEAQRTISHSLDLPMTIVAGERLPETEWRQITSLAKDVPQLTLKRSVNNMREAIRNARWTINQCGYNVAVDIIETGTPALFVPCSDGHRLDQITRAQRLVYWGTGRLLMSHHLNGASLANEIQQLTKFQSREVSFDLNGATRTAELISENVFGENFASLSVDDPILRPPN